MSPPSSIYPVIQPTLATPCQDLTPSLTSTSSSLLLGLRPQCLKVLDPVTSPRSHIPLTLSAFSSKVDQSHHSFAFTFLMICSILLAKFQTR